MLLMVKTCRTEAFIIKNGHENKLRRSDIFIELSNNMYTKLRRSDTNRRLQMDYFLFHLLF